MKQIAVMNETIFIIKNISAWQNTGVVASVLRKVNILREADGGDPVIMVTGYQPDLNRVCHILQYSKEAAGELSADTRVFGVYDHFQQTPCGDPDINGYDQKTETGGFAEHGYEGTHVKQVRRYHGATNLLKSIEYRDNNDQAEKVVFFNDSGDISMEREFVPGHQERWLHDCFFTPELHLCIKIEYTWQDKNDISQITLYDEDGQVLRTFSDNLGLAAYCLEQITADTSKTFLLVEEDNLQSLSLSGLVKPNILRACVVHSVFLENPYDLDSEPQYHFTGLCEHHAVYDAIIFLTEWERRDFIKKYGTMNNTFVIPHPYIVQSKDLNKRDRRKAVLIARFDLAKRINTAINIFRLVVDKIPDARLEIYGDGPQYLSLQYKKQIQELGLENNVVMMGYTNDPASVLREAALFMMTSLAEGYPLSLVESICNGCPAFSFDIKYGPSDIIIDGVTGFLITNNDEAAFADRIIQYLNDEPLQQRMSASAYHDARRFSKDSFLRLWNNMTETIFKRRYGAGRPARTARPCNRGWSSCADCSPMQPGLVVRCADCSPMQPGR